MLKKYLCCEWLGWGLRRRVDRPFSAPCAGELRVDVPGPDLPFVTGSFAAAQSAEADNVRRGLFLSSLGHQRLDPADEHCVVLRLAAVQQIGSVRPGAEAQLVAGFLHRPPDHVGYQFGG